MTTFTKTLILLAVATCGLHSVASAQNPRTLGMEFQRVRQQFNHQTGPSTYPQSRPHQHGHTYPVRRQSWVPPQFPVYLSPDQFNGFNPYTGGINTKNEQVDNTYYDQHREASKQNGTRRWVRRPIYDTRGNITGYQEGYVWTNSFTGVEHGELKNVTANKKGGVHEQIQLKSL